jgi:hypothetical protein
MALVGPGHNMGEVYVLVIWRGVCQACKAWQLLDLPPGLDFKNFTYYSHCFYVFCTDHRTESEFGLLQQLQNGLA